MAAPKREKITCYYCGHEGIPSSMTESGQPGKLWCKNESACENRRIKRSVGDRPKLEASGRVCSYCGYYGGPDEIKPSNHGMMCVNATTCVDRNRESLDTKQEMAGWEKKDGAWNWVGKGTPKSLPGSKSKSSYSGKGKGWSAGLTPKPFDFHPTGLKDVWAGRQMLHVKDAARLIEETGVTHVLDLREKREWTKPNIGEAPIAHLIASGVVRKNIAIRDMSAPGKAELEAGVAFLREAIQSGGKVYVHCRAGRERTASILWAYAFDGALEAPDWKAKIIDAWKTLDKQYPSFAPLWHQVEAVYRHLIPEGLVPCESCKLPLDVGPNVGRAYCKKCHGKQKTEIYKKQTAGPDYATSYIGASGASGTSNPAGLSALGSGSLFDEMPDAFSDLDPIREWKSEDLGMAACSACGEGAAQGHLGMCGDCEEQFREAIQ
jgi:rhodanese-related sulfurtransferase